MKTHPWLCRGCVYIVRKRGYREIDSVVTATFSPFFTIDEPCMIALPDTDYGANLRL